MGAIALMKTCCQLTSASTVRLGTTVRSNDAAVGVNRTFDPDGFRLPGVTRWVDRSGGISVGYPAIELSVRRPVNGSKLYRVKMTVSLPTLEQTSPSTASGIQPAPTKAYECFATLEFLLPERSALWERQALFDTVHSLFASTINASDDGPTDASGAVLKAAVENFDPPY
jgi:hypothetical protein